MRAQIIYSLVKKPQPISFQLRSMKVYTKTGDKGTSSLFTGQRVPKDHAVFNSLGTIDELNANLGVVMEYWVYC